MSEPSARTPMPTAVKVVLGLVFAVVGYYALGALGLVAYFFIGGDGPPPGDPEPAVELQAVNACGTLLFVSRQSGAGYSASTTYDEALAPGAALTVTDGQSFAVRELGGPWKLVSIASGDTPSIDGVNCPDPPAEASSGAVAARVPQLQYGRILRVQTDAPSVVPGADQNSEVTTVVVRMEPTLAEAWVSAYGMERASSVAPGLRPILDDAAPGANWVASPEFDRAVAEDALGSVAYIDPVTGTVVVRVWDDHSAS